MAERASETKPKHKWTFRARFRQRAFGWRSSLPIKRIKEAVSEIKKVARADSLLAGEGGVLLLEKLSPAIEQVDGSSGSIGTAAYNAILALVPIIAQAPADGKTRAAWAERLWAAREADDMPYLAEDTRQRISTLVANDTVTDRFVTRTLGRQLGLS
ncbi:MAG: hypothetical protein JKY65_10515 [Planctomycetes bacterium]|nr:hypothetical protein [Planctomycetota bacterium]